MKKSWMIVALLAWSVAPMARAGMIELRAGGGINSANPSSFEDEVNKASNGGLDSSTFDNYNADIFWDIPALPIGVGLRHEWINQSQSAGGFSWDLKAQNTSVLVDLRLLDTAVYLGPILSIGYPSAKLNFDTP